MRSVARAIQHEALKASRAFPAVVVTGPRRAGKTTLLRRLFPRARCILLEDPDMRARASSDPRAPIEELQPPVLFDEIRNAPELFAHVRSHIDAIHGKWASGVLPIR